MYVYKVAMKLGLVSVLNLWNGVRLAVGGDDTQVRVYILDSADNAVVTT